MKRSFLLFSRIAVSYFFATLANGARLAHLAQCKGEGATEPMQTLPSPYGVVERARKENTIINACMARNGYIQAQQ